MLALLALARSVLGLAASRGGLAAIGTAAALDVGPFGGGGGVGPFGDGRRRRRRRRALTASDKADIGFIAGILGKPAGRDFAMIVAART